MFGRCKDRFFELCKLTFIFGKQYFSHLQVMNQIAEVCQGFDDMRCDDDGFILVFQY